jgi:alkylation response protein AidB-like acyl-CoA dehydrogenase
MTSSPVELQLFRQRQGATLGLTTHSDAVEAAHRVAEAWAPGVIDRDRAGATAVPHEALRALDTLGLLEITVPARFGGSGLGPSTLAEVVRILAAAAATDLDEIGLVPADAAAAARGSLSVAAAKAFGSEVAVEAGSQLFALAGTNATDERWDLHRHWRNARTHSVHDPVDWKYHHLGAYEIGDVLPPNHGQL